jgi:hypothetical protein
MTLTLPASHSPELRDKLKSIDSDLASLRTERADAARFP